MPLMKWRNRNLMRSSGTSREKGRPLQDLKSQLRLNEERLGGLEFFSFFQGSIRSGGGAETEPALPLAGSTV